jgi:predicted dienelactone hydrolase
MRFGLLGLLLLVAGLAMGSADAQPFRAGLMRATVPDDTPFEILVAYPTQAAEGSVEAGPFELSASRDAAVAGSAGTRFPLVVFSHGSGRGPGSPLPHGGLLLHLAREGFVVVAPFHSGGGRPFDARPRQIRKAVEFVQTDPRFAAHVDAARVGAIGFSFGGAVALLAAGAKLDLAHLARYCRDRRDDPRACDGVPTDGSLAGVPARKSPHAIALRALVLLEPFGAPFGGPDLASLDMPVLIYRALESDLRAEGNALALAQALARSPQQRAVPGGHFVFVDPCPAALASEAPQVCRDPPGVDRAAIQSPLRQEIASFLRSNL